MKYLPKQALFALAVLYNSGAQANYSCQDLLTQEPFTDILMSADGREVDTLSDIIQKSRIPFGFKTHNFEYVLTGVILPQGSPLVHDTIRTGALKINKNNLGNYEILVNNIDMINDKNCTFDVAFRYSSNRSIKNNQMINNVVVYKRTYHLQLDKVIPSSLKGNLK